MVDSKLEVEGSIRRHEMEVGSSPHGLVDGDVRRREMEVGSNHHCLVEDNIRRHCLVDVVVVGMVVEHIVPDGLDRSLVCHYLCDLAPDVVGLVSIEQALLKLLAQTQVPT